NQLELKTIRFLGNFFGRPRDLSAQGVPVRHTYFAHLRWWSVALLPLVFLGFFLLLPLAEVFRVGLFDGTTWSQVTDILTENRTAKAAGTTVALAGLGTIGSALLGIPAAYALYRLEWPGARTVRSLLTIPFILPTVVVAAAFTALFGRSGVLGG